MLAACVHSYVDPGEVAFVAEALQKMLRDDLMPRAAWQAKVSLPDVRATCYY